MKNMKKQLLLVTIIVVLLTYIATLLYASNYPIKSNIPIMDIKLNKEISLEQIHNNNKDIKYENNILTINDKKYNNVTIKGRGHFTWKQQKRPYQISFEEKTSILDLPETKKYVLLANYFDPTLLKNDFTFQIAKEMNLNYSQSGKYIDLYIDGKYLGNYYIIPKIDINKASVNLKDDNAIMMELDNLYYEEEDEYYITTYFKDHLTIKDSQNDDYQIGLKAFQEKYNLMEKNIIEKNYDWLKNNVDLDSLVKYYIIAEFAGNTDSIKSSLFFYMDGPNDIIHVGPIWDFDVAYGFLLTETNTSIITNDFKPYFSTDLFAKLLEINEFSNKVSNYWKNDACHIYKKQIDNIDNKIIYLNTSGENNSIYWNKKHYKDYTNKLEYWINERYKFFNNKYGCDKNG